jgi:hypothetical protein
MTTKESNEAWEIGVCSAHMAHDQLPNRAESEWDHMQLYRENATETVRETFGDTPDLGELCDAADAGFQAECKALGINMGEA